MRKLATILPITSPVKILLSPEEQNIVDLVSTTVIKKTFDYETRTEVPALQQRRTKQSLDRKTGHSNRRMDEA